MYIIAHYVKKMKLGNDTIKWSSCNTDLSYLALCGQQMRDIYDMVLSFNLRFYCAQLFQVDQIALMLYCKMR